MIKVIKIEKFEGAAVLIPDGKTDISAKDLVIILNTHEPYHPDDRWFLLGKSTELTEEQLKLIIPDTFRRRRFSHFQDILEAHGCYSVNPMGKELDIEDYLSGSQYHHFKREWDKYQANTGTWIILKKIT